MSNLPDNFNLSSFEDRYPPENERLDREREYLVKLRAALEGLEGIPEPTDAQEREMTTLENQIAAQVLLIESLEGA